MWRGLVPTMLILFLTSCAVEQDLAPSPRGYPVHGIDVSKFQGDIDWRAVKKSGVDFAFIKATEGGDRFDERFRENWSGAGGAGVARGAYHFYYFCRPAADQADWFIRHVPNDRLALPPVLDMEWNGHSPTCPKKKPRAHVLSEMRIFLDKIERHFGRKAIIYTSVDFHEEILEGEFTDHQFWLRSVAGSPTKKFKNRPWRFWQFTGTGAVGGVEGEVDRNVFGGTRKAWGKWLKELKEDQPETSDTEPG